MVSCEELKVIIEKGIPGATANVSFFAEKMDHFQVHVVADAFKEKNLVDRHQMIYAAVGDLSAHEIHALKIQAVTQEE